MKIGFMGLGTMGKGMALNMLKSGCELTVYDIVPHAFPEFEAKGAKTTTDPAQVAKADCVFLSLPNTKIVESVVCGENGILQHMSKGQIIVDLSTISYLATVRIAKACAEKEVGFLDAPVSGMKARAIDGTLTVMCGGEEDIFQKVKPYLDCIGNKVLLMGANGCGQMTKLINQLLFDINAAAIAEILPLSAKMGLDSEKVGEVVNSGTGRSYASEFFIPRILDGVFDEGYPMEHAYKDLVSAAELGAQEGIPLPVLGAATVTFQMALLKGLGPENKGAMIKVYESLLDTQFRK